MSLKHLPVYALVLAVVVVGAVIAGAPVTTLLLLLLVLACPLMMLFMHGGHAGHGENSGGHESDRHSREAGSSLDERHSDDRERTGL